MKQEIYQIIADRVDWNIDELSDLKRRLDQGDHLDAVIRDFIRHLRSRRMPNLGYSAEYVVDVRNHASSEAVEAARQRWEKKLDETLFTHHFVSFSRLEAETIIAAATPDLCRRTAEKILDFQPHWEREGGSFGPVFGICQLLSFLFPLEECSDEDLAPLLAWLVVQAPKEWERSRGWNEVALGNSGHNWWAHSFYGLWLGSLFFPEFKPLRKFSAFYPVYVERELKLLFENDGWSKEGALGYHLSGAYYMCYFAWYADINGLKLTARIKERLGGLFAQIWKQLAPDGHYPGFHDDGTGPKKPDYESEEYRAGSPSSFWDWLRAFYAIHGNGEGKFALEQVFPEWRPAWDGFLPFLGKNVFQEYRQLPPRPVALDSVIPDGGYYMMRQNWTPDSDYMAINAGIVGPLVTSHKHMDMFNIVLYSRGRCILADNWYGDEEEMVKEPMVRRWRVGSSAHNVATVDNLDQGEIRSVFRYGTSLSPLIEDWRSETDYAYFSGSHEGYQRLKSVVTCGRKIFYLRSRYWIMIDRFTTDHWNNPPHDYQLHFQIEVPSELDADGRLYTSGKGGNLAIVPVPGARGLARKTPNPYPIRGYNNPDYLCYEQKQCGDAAFITLLIPFLDDDRPRVEVEMLDVECDDRILLPREATGLRIRIDDHEDFYFDQHMHWNLPWRIGPHSGTQRLWHSIIDK
jgi:hypothetical protein